MTGYCLDASALVKRYADEPGSVWILRITDPAVQHTVLLAEITLAEVAAALAAKQRAPGGLTLKERDRTLSRFLQDCDEHFLLLPVDRGVIDRAVDLTQRYRLGPPEKIYAHAFHDVSYAKEQEEVTRAFAAADAETARRLDPFRHLGQAWSVAPSF